MIIIVIGWALGMCFIVRLFAMVVNVWLARWTLMVEDGFDQTISKLKSNIKSNMNALEVSLQLVLEYRCCICFEIGLSILNSVDDM